MATAAIVSPDFGAVDLRGNDFSPLRSPGVGGGGFGGLDVLNTDFGGGGVDHLGKAFAALKAQDNQGVGFM